MWIHSPLHYRLPSALLSIAQPPSSPSLSSVPCVGVPLGVACSILLLMDLGALMSLPRSGGAYCMVCSRPTVQDKAQVFPRRGRPTLYSQPLCMRSCWSHAHSQWGRQTSFLPLGLEGFSSWTCHLFPLSPMRLNSSPWIPSHCDPVQGRASSCYFPNLLGGVSCSH